MDRKEKRKMRRHLKNRVRMLHQVVTDPIAAETGCNMASLNDKLVAARHALYQLSR